MRVRGRRECQSCGAQWSYYETGSVTCPECGSLRSVGLDERTRHTDAPVEFDLTPVRNRVDEATTRELAEQAAERAGEYVRKRGFVSAGDLAPLDAVYVAATELQYAAEEIARGLRTAEDEELYFLALLRGADEGERPPVEEVPDSLAQARGLAMAAVTDAYQRDVRRILEDDPDPEARRLNGRIRDHRKRIEALDGDVDPADAERLLKATRDLGRYLDGEESALVTADNWLSGIGY
ncbi:MAG: TFIIB-type zinc ribbon-containing protein [Haloarculaceae archaeon]